MRETGIIAIQNMVSHPLSFLMKAGSPWIEAHRDLIIREPLFPRGPRTKPLRRWFPQRGAAILEVGPALRDPDERREMAVAQPHVEPRDHAVLFYRHDDE